MKLFAEINKIDEEQRMVWGYASTTSRDSQGEVVSKEAVKNAWDAYMKFANIREMHQPSAVGVVKEYSFEDNGVLIGAKIVDDNAWKKVQEKVYKGFSIGGKKLEDGYDPAKKMITGMQLTEISLVDRPANPEALITMFKLEDSEKGNCMSEIDEQYMDEILDMLSSGAISAESLLKIAKAVPPKDKASKEEEEAVLPKDKASKEEEEAVPPKDKASKEEAVPPKDKEKVKKNINSVSALIEILQLLKCVCDWESTKNSSTTFVQLRSCLKELSAVFIEVAKESVSELETTNISAQSAIMLGEKTNNEASEKDNAIFKMGNTVEKMAQDISKLRTELSAAEDTIKVLQKQPTLPKGKLFAVEKSSDAGLSNVEVVPVLKSDGTVDVLATAVKKVHASGGHNLFSKR